MKGQFALSVLMFLTLVAFAGLLVSQNLVIPPQVCTLEAMLCPDGSSVGRDPNNNCEFSPCPGAGTPSDYASLANMLRARGMNVTLQGEVNQPYIPMAGQGLVVNGEVIQAFKFSTPAAAHAFAKTISPDGTKVGDTIIEDTAPLQWYRSQNLIVLYRATDINVIGALDVLLQKFAGPTVTATVLCPPSSRDAEFCIELYQPVCGWFDPEKIQCIRYPCAQTYSNSCFACQNPNVSHYTNGACPA